MDEFKKKVIRTTTLADTPFAPAPDIFAPKPLPISKPKTPTPDLSKGISKRVSDIMATIPKTEKTTGFTQQDINDLQAQGVDVFDPHILKQISRIEQGAQENLNLQEQAIANLLGKEPPPTAAEEITPLGITKGNEQYYTPEELEQIRAGKSEIEVAVIHNLGVAAEVINGAISLFTQQESPSVAVVESTLKQATTMLNNEIELIQKGQIPAYLIEEDFARVNEAINRLERTSKRANTINLRYKLLGKQKEIDTEILLAKKTFNNLYNNLENTIAAGYQARALAATGETPAKIEE